MKKTTASVLLAGFGGQGILFAGKVLAYAGLLSGKQVSWLPSYGPQMRGGTANCGVVLSDEEIGSPLVLHPDYLIVMNQPSFDQYAPQLAEGGQVILDSTLVTPQNRPSACVDATRLAQQNALPGLANIVMLGKFLHESSLVELSTVKKALEECLSLTKRSLLDRNVAALQLGFC